MHGGDGLKKLKTAAVTAMSLLMLPTASVYAENKHNTGVYNIAELVEAYNLMKADGIIDDNWLDFQLTLLIQTVPEDIYSIRINEVSTNGEDWIELFNSGHRSINLNGWGISDKADDLKRFIFPDISIGAGEYLMVYADKEGTSAKNKLTANFGLSKDGDELYLTSPDGLITDHVAVPPLDDEHTYGRYRQSDDMAMLFPTPDEANDSVQRYLAGPTFSKESGFYEDDISLTLTGTKGCEIYYTTDGSVPTAESKHYTRPIKITDRTDQPNDISMNRTATYPTTVMNYAPTDNIAKSTVIRAVEADEYGNISNAVTHSYFVGKELCEKYEGTPIFSLAVDPNDLFDYDTGIYTTGKYYDIYKSSGWVADNEQTWMMSANFTQKCTGDDRTWEKPVHVEMFTADRDIGFSQDMGVRIFGASSRANLQKSLKLIARSTYGKGKLKYPLISDSLTADGAALEKYDSCILRCGANDAVWTKFRDPVLQELVRDRDFETQRGFPAIAFLNGEYWGIYQITEDYSDNYISNKYGYDKENVVIIKNGELEDGTQQDFDDYKLLVKFVRNNDMSVKENYKKLCEMVDVQSMADYHASQIYINNQDIYGDAWMNNIRMWKLRNAEDDSIGDGKWRWMLYDTEYSTYLYGLGNDYDALMNFSYENCDNVIFAKTFRQNKEFRQLFLNTIMDLANENYNEEKVNAEIDKYYGLYSPLMDEHVKRFGPLWRVRELNTNFYEKEADRFRSFFKGRRERLAAEISSMGYGKGTSELTVTVNNSDWGTVQINSITPEIKSTGWKGLYFNNCEITLTAIPNEGYVFEGWSGLAKGKRQKTKITLSEASTVKASFRKE